MKLTRNVVIFGGINLVSTIIFLTVLHQVLLSNQTNTDPPTFESIVPSVYALFWLLSGLLLGGTDKQRNSRQNIGFLYHAVTMLVSGIGLIIGAILFDEYKSWGLIVIGLLLLASSPLIHWLIIRKQLKGISKQDAFK